MANRQPYGGTNGRDLRFEESRGQRDSAGGRSESYSRERDAEQRRAGYPGEQWSRQKGAQHNVRSEPHWDPTEGYPAQPRHEYAAARDELRQARDRGSHAEHREGHEASFFGREHPVRDAGRYLAGRFRRIVRNPKNYQRSDERIREDVCDRLAISEEVDPTDVEVTVSDGQVSLVGTVADRYQKFVAEEIADDVPGVHEVDNRIRVRRA